MYFRYYLGRKPRVLIADPDMLRQILVKDFTFFPNRQVSMLTRGCLCVSPTLALLIKDKCQYFFPRLFMYKYGYFTKPLKDCLLMLTNERWKRVRSIVTPTFSTAKLKEVRSFYFNCYITANTCFSVTKSRNWFYLQNHLFYRKYCIKLLITWKLNLNLTYVSLNFG